MCTAGVSACALCVPALCAYGEAAALTGHVHLGGRVPTLRCGRRGTANPWPAEERAGTGQKGTVPTLVLHESHRGDKPRTVHEDGKERLVTTRGGTATAQALQPVHLTTEGAAGIS